MKTTGARLLAGATWHAQEAERLREEISSATDGHKAAIGAQQLRRMEVDAETHQQLADEYRAHVSRAYPEELEDASDHVDVAHGLF